MSLNGEMQKQIVIFTPWNTIEQYTGKNVDA